MTCAPCMQQSPGGSDDQDTRNAACWWTLDVLELEHGGRCCDGFGIGAGIGSTTDGNLMLAANAVMALNDPCNLTVSGATVGVFQAAWNNTSDPNMQSSLDASNNPIGTLTDDGKYGPETAAAVQNATGALSPSPCTSYTGSWAGGGGGGGGAPASYSAAVVAAATALDAYLAANGCTSCKAAGANPSGSDPLSALVSAFKNAILVSPGSTSTSAATVTGSTINMSSAACQQSYGPGTIADLSAVLGAGKKSGATACTDASCNCLAAFQGPPAPPPTPVTPPSTSSSSSSAAPLVAAAILLGLGGAAVYQASKKRKGAPAHAGAY